MPCLADPGSDLVFMVRQAGIAISALTGPSSILLALVLSGLGGQKFTFHGYLPREEALLTAELQKIEALSKEDQSTNLFIEAPYRNLKMFDRLLGALSRQTLLCIACDLTGEGQFVDTRSVGEWKRSERPDLHKRPTVFSLKSAT